MANAAPSVLLSVREALQPQESLVMRNVFVQRLCGYLHDERHACLHLVIVSCWHGDGRQALSSVLGDRIQQDTQDPPPREGDILLRGTD